MSKYLKRKIHKRANMKQIISLKEKTDQLIKSPIDIVMEDIEVEYYCKKNIQVGINKKDFELVNQSLELCNYFNWYYCDYCIILCIRHTPI